MMSICLHYESNLETCLHGILKYNWYNKSMTPNEIVEVKAYQLPIIRADWKNTYNSSKSLRDTFQDTTLYLKNSLERALNVR